MQIFCENLDLDYYSSSDIQVNIEPDQFITSPIEIVIQNENAFILNEDPSLNRISKNRRSGAHVRTYNRKQFSF